MTQTSTFAGWTARFEAEEHRRREQGDPDWSGGASLPPPLVRSIQKFQVGESGDGANVIGKAEAAGDPDYTAAVRLFVAEEQNHARLLARLLDAAGAPTIDGDWTDTVFVLLRRALGLRLELMVLMVAETVALRYYRALRDGTDDPLTSEVARRILADERRHVPFHCLRIGAALAQLPGAARSSVVAAWSVLLLGATVVVALTHGAALRCLRVTRRAFVAGTLAEFRAALELVADATSGQENGVRGRASR